MVRLSQEEFLSGLARMYSSSAEAGSVVTTFKRYNEHKKGAKGGESSSGSGKSAENLCIVRASKGSKKISTVVRAADLAQFHTNYSNILKVRVTALVPVPVQEQAPTSSAPASAKKVRKKSRR